MLFAEHPEDRTYPYLKIGGDAAKPQAFSAGRPDCGYLRGIGFLKAFPPERSAL